MRSARDSNPVGVKYTRLQCFGFDAGAGAGARAGAKARNRGQILTWARFRPAQHKIHAHPDDHKGFCIPGEGPCKLKRVPDVLFQRLVKPGPGANALALKRLQGLFQFIKHHQGAAGRRNERRVPVHVHNTAGATRTRTRMRTRMCI